MPSIMGYGEDALTYWALNTRLPEILGKLQDRSSAEGCKIYFRPSFGRAGGQSKPHFGEFDAIVVSSLAIYLIESKWDGLRRSRRKTIVLKDAQWHRHQTFRKLLAEWRNWRSANNPQEPVWEEFRLIARESEKPLASDDALLAKNQMSILRQLESTTATPVDVLLYFCRSGLCPPDNHKFNVRSKSGESTPAFKTVILSYAPVDQSGFFEM
jgi:hypothetical protein